MVTKDYVQGKKWLVLGLLWQLIMTTPVNADNIGNPLPFVIVQICLMYNVTISR